MTIYPPRPAPFTCAICCDPQMSKNHSALGYYIWAGEYPIPPLCRRCEIDYGAAIGGQGDRNRDRRIIRQISALAAALTAEAYQMHDKKGPRHGRA